MTTFFTSRLEKLTTYAVDGPIKGPVWVQHLVKVATSGLISLVVYLMFNHWLDYVGAALIGGYAFYITLHTAYALWPQLSGDATHYGFLDTTGDYFVDFACALVWVPIAQFLQHNPTTGAIGTFVLVVVWFTLLPWSRP